MNRINIETARTQEFLPEGVIRESFDAALVQGAVDALFLDAGRTRALGPDYLFICLYVLN